MGPCIPAVQGTADCNNFRGTSRPTVAYHTSRNGVAAAGAARSAGGRPV